MLKKDREEYKRKLQFISDNAQDIDYDWFDKDGLIVWIDDYQKKKMFYIGYLAMDRDGKFYVFQDESTVMPSLTFPDVWDYKNQKISISKIQTRTYDKLPDVIDWFFKYVSLNSMLWRVNRIYQELSG